MLHNTEEQLIAFEKQAYTEITKPYWSASSLTTLLTCGFKYDFSYVKKIGLRIPDYNLALGSAMHKAMQYYFADCWANDGENRIKLDGLIQVFLDEWEIQDKTLMDRKDYDHIKAGKCSAQGVSMIESYFERLEKIPLCPLNFRPENSTEDIPAVELDLRAPIVNLKTGEVISTTHDLLGHIDLISNSRNGVGVDDHKTSSRQYTEFQTKTSVQLLIYSYLYRYFAREGRLTLIDGSPAPKTEKYVAFNVIMKTKDNEFSREASKITDSDLERLYYIIGVAEKIKESKAFLPANNMSCNYCDFNIRDASVCMEYQRSMKIEGNPKMSKIFGILKGKYGAKEEKARETPKYLESNRERSC